MNMANCASFGFVLDIDRRIPGLLTRIWPARFIEAQPEIEAQLGTKCEDSNPEYHGCILVGLEWDAVEDRLRTKADLREAKATLLTILDAFESRIRGDSTYYDGKACWVSTKLVHQREVKGLQLDTRQWAEYSGLEDDTDSELGDGSDGLDDENEDTQAADSPIHRPAPLPCAKISQGKLRTAADVINRIRWDEALDAGDFVVGYEDRFVGIKERPLEDWTGEQTDEEFIPQHRIQYFKRRSDGMRLWDRNSRTDLIFGSGADGQPKIDPE